MLLVAMLALGTATFAWFTSNPNASAAGISLKTTASAGLVIRTDSDATWDHEAVLNNGGSTFNLQPASQVEATPDIFWKVLAADAGAPAAKGTEAMENATKGGWSAQDTSAGAGDVYKEKVYFRLSDGSDATANSTKVVKLTGVTITKNTDATMDGCIRVAVVAADGTLLGTYSNGNNSANPTRLAPKSDADKTPGTPTAYTVTTAATGLDVSTLQTALPATANNQKYVTVYVYLDGQDAECYSDKVGTVNAAEIISSIQLDFTLA